MRSLLAQVGRLEGFRPQLSDEFGIQSGAGRNHLRQLGGIAGIAVRDHSSGGGGGFEPRLALLYNEDVCAAVPQPPRQRQPDDPSTNDDNIPSLHALIVVERKPEARLLPVCGSREGESPRQPRFKNITPHPHRLK